MNPMETAVHMFKIKMKANDLLALVNTRKDAIERGIDLAGKVAELIMEGEYTNIEIFHAVSMLAAENILALENTDDAVKVLMYGMSIKQYTEDLGTTKIVSEHIQKQPCSHCGIPGMLELQTCEDGIATAKCGICTEETGFSIDELREQLRSP